MAQYRIFDLCVRISANTKGDKQVVISTKRPGGVSIPVIQWICGPGIDTDTWDKIMSAVEDLLFREVSQIGGIQHVLM